MKNFYAEYIKEYKKVIHQGFVDEESIFKNFNLDLKKLSELNNKDYGEFKLFHDTKSIFLDHIEKYEYLYELLNDTYSKEQYIKYYTFQTLNSKFYRAPFDIKYFITKQNEMEKLIENKSEYKSLDIGIMNIFNLNKIGFNCKIWASSLGIVLDFILEQYRYKNLVEVEKNDVVIDCGGAIGDTAVYFASKGCSKVYVYEFIPSSLQMIDAQLKLNPTMNDTIEVVENAVWKESGITLSYVDRGNASQVGEYGLYPNNVVTLSIDELVKKNNIKKVDIIKMDIEGAEYEALLGAKETIKRFKPKLMISVYHKKDDLYTIPTLIKSMSEDYDFYFDYYTDIGWEAILYAKHKEL